MLVQPQVDVDAVIDESSISRFQISIFVLSFLIIMFDGFDTQAVAYVAPSLASEWKLAAGSFGPVFSSALLGSMLGALLFGFIADKIGRRVTLAWCVAMFGAMNVACAFSNSIETFIAIRFICGIGLGGAIPNVMALVSEYAPARRRAVLVATTWWGFALGAVFGGLLSVPLIAEFGWPSVFIAGGVLPLCIVPFIALTLPESIKFLISSGKGADVVASLLQRISPKHKFDANTRFVLNETMPDRANLLALFRSGLAVGTIFLCLALFMSLVLVYCLINWIPLLLREAGLPLKDALMGTIIFNLSGIVGSFFCTRLIDREGSRPILILGTAYFLGAIAVISIGYAGTAFWPIVTAIFMSGFFIIGVQLSLNAYISNYYPTSIRATGIGWSQTFGRTGSLTGPLVGGALVAQGMTPSQLFQISSVAPFLACLSLIIFAKLSPRVPHEQPAEIATV